MKRINIKNIEKLNEAIKVAEGRATARTITAQDIINVLKRIEVPKSRLNGTTVHYDGAEMFAKAYKYTPESTHWIAENVKGNWYITDIYRDTCPNTGKRKATVKYSEEAQAYIIAQASLLV